MVPGEIPVTGFFAGPDMKHLGEKGLPKRVAPFSF
jgi:hypothetical protein